MPLRRSPPAADPVFAALVAAGRREIDHGLSLDDVDPAVLVAASGTHGVDHVLLDWLKKSSPGHGAVAPLQERNRMHARFHYRTLVALRSASSALMAAGVAHVAIKGPILATLSQASPCRAYSDLDLVVEPRSLEAALDVLTEQGAELSAAGGWRHLYATQHAQVPMLLPFGVPLDLHWHLCSRPHMRRSFTVDDAASLIARSMSLETATCDVTTLGWDDMLVHTAAHAGWSGGDRLGWFVDVDSVVRSGSIHWDTVVARARAWGLEALVGDVLRRSRELLETPIPAEVPDALRGGAMGTLLRTTERLRPMSALRYDRSARRMLHLDLRSGLSRTVVAVTFRAATATARRARQRSLSPVDAIELRRADDEKWREQYVSFAMTEVASTVPRAGPLRRSLDYFT